LLDSLVFRSNTCTRMLDELNVRALREEIQAAQRGLIIIGRLQERSEKRAAALIAERLDWPCFLDINSGLKACLDNEILDPSYPLIRQELESYKPDFVLHLGRRLVSRFFDEYIHRHQPKSYWVVSKEEGIQDPSHLPQRQQLNCSLSLLSDTIPKNYGRTTPAHQSLLAASEKAREALLLNSSLEFCFAAVAQTIVSLLPKRRHGLFLGNSTAIRAFDSWCDLRSGRVSDIEANRGVSGIEGLLATTLGLVLGSDHAWTTVLGDISLIHDLNSVLSIPRAKHPVILVVVNNSGGRIFENLPLKAHHWVKDPLITTPHDYSFVGLAQMAGIDYHLCLDQMSFTKVYAEAIQTGRSWIIECQQDPLADQRFSQRFQFQETAP
ncbi:MAG: hypothetical protein NTX25_16430, partial [Proteobacteria bacterium]|nr:hypothetical protein [Pseudomonadota bacterium]